MESPQKIICVHSNLPRLLEIIERLQSCPRPYEVFAAAEPNYALQVLHRESPNVVILHSAFAEADGCSIADLILR